MSLRTCSWLLPQNEQRYGTLVLLLPLVVLIVSALALPSRSPRSALRLLLVAGRRRLLLRLGFLDRARNAGALPAREAEVVGLRDQRRTRERVDGIDDAIRLGVVRGHEAVPVRVLDDRLERLAGVPSQDLV